MKRFAGVMFLLVLFVAASSSVSFAETVTLKSGKKVEGKILEQDKNYVKVDVEGIPVSYWAEEIESVVSSDGRTIVFEKTEIQEVAPEPELESEPRSPLPAASPVNEEPAPALVSAAAAGITRESAPSPDADVNTIPHRRTQKIPAAVSFSVIIFAFFFFVVVYIYVSFCLQKIAEKTQTPNGWLAWIPLLNLVLICDIAQRPRWWIALFLLGLIPVIGVIICVIVQTVLYVDMAKRRNKSVWWGILTIIPLGFFITMGYLAFSE